MAILSGNTDLLDKAKLEKKIASLEGERKSFNKGKRDSELKLKSKSEELDGNRVIIKGMTADYDKFMSQAKKDKDGNILNLITLNGLESNNLEVIGKHLQGWQNGKDRWGIQGNRCNLWFPHQGRERDKF